MRAYELLVATRTATMHAAELGECVRTFLLPASKQLKQFCITSTQARRVSRDVVDVALALCVSMHARARACVCVCVLSQAAETLHDLLFARESKSVQPQRSSSIEDTVRLQLEQSVKAQVGVERVLRHTHCASHCARGG
jgi:hypothetical protein